MKVASLNTRQKVGTGFNGRLENELFVKFQSLVRKRCPFADLPQPASSHQTITRSDMTRCVWLEPSLVAQINFSEWTAGGHLRHPAFVALREDKPAKEVTREKPG
jgi:bifunctional non-homologous end joining protein LigD